MKLKRNCLFFNAKTNEQGRTPDWGQELGQGKGYLMKIDGCSDIINGLVYNQILDLENFSYGSGGGKYEIQIVSLFRDVNIKIYDFQKKIHLNHKLNNSLILIIAKEVE